MRAAPSSSVASRAEPRRRPSSTGGPRSRTGSRGSYAGTPHPTTLRERRRARPAAREHPPRSPSSCCARPATRSRRRRGALDEAELIAALDGRRTLLGHPLQDPGHRDGAAQAAPSCWRSAPSASAPTRSTSRGRRGRGVAVFNAPFSNTRSVVELAIAEIIALTRRLTEQERRACTPASGTSRPTGATRSAAARWASSATATSAASCRCSPRRSGMRVLFYDTADKLALGNAAPLRQRSRAARDGRGRSPCTSTAGRATPACSARSSSRRMRPRSAVPQPVPRLRRRPRGAARAHPQSGHIAGAAIDVFPDRAEGAGRRVRLRRCAGCPT